MNRLKADNATKDAVTALVKYHDTDVLENGKNIKKWLGKLGAELFGKLIDLKFKVKDKNAKNTEVKVILEENSICNYNEELIAAKGKNGTVKIK